MSYSYLLLLYLISAVVWGSTFLPAVAERTQVRDSARWAGLFLNLVGLLLAVVYLGGLWLETGHPPFRTLQQSLVVFSVTTTITWALALRQLPLAGLAAAAFNALILGYGATKADGNVHEMPPALQSAWFVPHVVVYFLGYAGLFFSFLTSILYFFTVNRLADPVLSARFEARTHRFILFGFCMLSVGLILGAFWAKVAWGDWWSWDPKENWALISWILYGVWLHLRRVEGITPKASVALAVVGFLAVLFTYLGVNYLPQAQSTLHSYTMDG